MPGPLPAAVGAGGEGGEGEVGAAEVIAIRPSVSTVPRNLLRLYVWFSQPMEIGRAYEGVSISDSHGEPIPDVLYPSRYELWDAEHRRLTVLLDPARIKRGMTPDPLDAYPLEVGDTIDFVISADRRDASGRPLRAEARRRYQVGTEVREIVDTTAWRIHPPRVGAAEPVVVEFDRPLDHGLLLSSLQVIGPDGRAIAGVIDVRLGDQSWSLTPKRAWSGGAHHLRVDPRLEDLVGNSVRGAFERPAAATDDPRPADGPILLAFEPEPI